MIWQRVLDDLQEGESRIEVDCGETLIKGIYFGLLRVQLDHCVKWYIDIRKTKKSTNQMLVTRESIKGIKVCQR